MRRLWKKVGEIWKAYWMDDCGDEKMTHLSQTDKRSLLYGGFMICMLTCMVFVAAVAFGNYRADRENAESMAEVLNTVNTYLATATEDEYEEIVRTIRRDLVFSEYGQEIENLIQYIPNTADGCCLERGGFLERVNLLFLNTGEMYGLDLSGAGQNGFGGGNGYSVQLTCGYDEISGSRIYIRKEAGTGTADLCRETGVVSVHKMKGLFCDECIRKILTAVENEQAGEAVIYDAQAKEFYPVSEGPLQIGEYELEICYEQGDYKIQIE